MSRLTRKAKIIGGLVLLAVIAVILGITLYFTIGGGNSPAPTNAPPVTAPPVTAPPVTAPPVTPPPTVTVQQGLLEGVWKTLYGNDAARYVAFYGIPYALPPVGPLRFKSPKEPVAWEGVKKADVEGLPCTQIAYGTGELLGSEDCLFMNVYTPSLPDEMHDLLKPVYVFIHGGGFVGGSADSKSFGPDYFLEHDFLVVTVQYRLGALGFLSLDTEEVPGNGGVKDLVAALQWVHKNIAVFGGDPKKITIGGQSAGSGLASWLTLLPEMEGIIHSAILESGSAYHNWAYKEDHVRIALRLASLLAGTEVTDVETATKYLMSASTAVFAKQASELGTEESKSQPELPFRPTPERRPRVAGGQPLLITRDAESYFLSPAAARVPHIICVNNAEWRRYYYQNNPKSDPQIDKEMARNVMWTVPRNVIPFKDTQDFLGLSELPADFDYNTVIGEIEDGIVASPTPSCDLGCVLLQYFDGIWMAEDSHRLGMWRAKENVETYLIRFGVRSGLNGAYPVSPIPEDAKNAAQHADELPYLWHDELNQGTQDSTSILATKRMVTLWANFIKYGKPIPEKSELLPVDWLPNTSTGTDVTFLDFGPELTLRTDSLSGVMISFWDKLYKKYRTPS